MPIVGGLDIHRKQLTFDYLDTVTGEVKRGQIAPAGRVHLRAWLARFARRDDVAFALEGCAGWRYVAEELAGAGVAAHVAEPADTAFARGRKRHAKTDPLTELTAAVDQVSGRAGALVASVARHEHRRRWAAGSVPACGAAARVAGVDRGCVRAVPAGRCGWDGGRPGGGVSAGAGGVRAHGRDAAVVCV